MRKKAAIVVAGALFAFQAIGIIGATSASATGTCTYNAATDTVSIVIDDSTQVNVAVDATTGQFLSDASGVYAPCGSATNSNVATVVVLSASNAGYHDFGIDEAFGDPFASSINWVVDLTVGTGSWLFFYLNDEVDNALTLTNDSFTLNGAAGELLGITWFYVFGGDGDDTVDASALTEADEVGLYAEGDDGDDSLTGGSWEDDLFGEAGDDYLAGGDSDDSVDGGVGGDTIDEGAAPNGNDTLEDGGTDGVPAEDDTLDYSARTGCIIIDEVANESGEDSNCDGDLTDTADELDAENGFEILMSGSNDDILVGNGSDETFVPGDGDDDVDGDGGTDTLDYSTSSAAMLIDPAAGTATGQGADEFAAVEAFVGSDFDDTLLFDGTTVGFDGGDGVDLIDGSAQTDDLTIDLNVFENTENAIGGSGDDTIEGNNVQNSLWGMDGDDFIDGNGGNDTLYGGLGNDDFEGGEGADTVSFEGSAAGVEVDMSLGFASGEGDDSFVDFIEIVVGSALADDITGGQIGFGSLNFRVSGLGGNDNITGSDSNDNLSGGGGKDVIRSGNGDDTLKGGKGNDKLYGGKGTDIGKGGKGDDVCKGIEIRSSCGKASNPKRVPAAPLVAAKLV